MAPPVLRTATALLCATVLAAALPTVGWTQEKEDPNKPAERPAGQRELEDIAEAARQMTGPAANYECIWHGTRVVNLLHRDDLDTALRQLQMYDRFGCPSAHVQTAFRCFLRPTGPRDPKTGDARFDQRRALDCWVNPSLVAAPASPTASPPTAAATTSTPARPGTTNR